MSLWIKSRDAKLLDLVSSNWSLELFPTKQARQLWKEEDETTLFENSRVFQVIDKHGWSSLWCHQSRDTLSVILAWGIGHPESW